jgi:epsilon-lactone hydrolase
MRGRFERFSRVSRQALQRKFPKLVFADHAVNGLAIESVCAVESPARVILYLHGGAFFMGSPASYRNRAMRLSYRCQAEVFVPEYRLARSTPILQHSMTRLPHGSSLRPYARTRRSLWRAIQPEGA